MNSEESQSESEEEQDSSDEGTDAAQYQSCGSYDDVSDTYLQQGPLSIESTGTRGKANRLFNYLSLEFADADVIHEREIEKAITRVGNDTEYYIEKYTPLVTDRLQDHGWVRFPYNDLWMADAETAAEMLDAQLEDFEPELLGEEPPKLVGSGGDVEAETKTERIQNLLERFRERRELYVEYGVMSPERADAIERSGAELLMEYSSGRELVG